MKDNKNTFSRFLHVLVLLAVLGVLAGGMGLPGAGLLGRAYAAETQQTKAQAKKSYVRDGYTLIEFHFGEKDRFFAELSAELSAKNPKICLKNYSPIIWNTLEKCDYCAFMVKGWSSDTIEVTGDVEETYEHIDFEYFNESESEIRRMKREIDDAARRILSKARTCEDDWHAVKAIHDELCATITYDQSKSLPHTHDLYGALVRHEAVCSGYASAFRFLVSQLGYGTARVSSKTHSWNFVNTDGSDCFVDVTWDDMDLCDRYGRPYVTYDHFFLTESEMESVGQHTYIDFSHTITHGQTKGGLNYHACMGYYLTSWDADAVEDVLYHQYKSGSNLLTVKFQNDADYRKALAWAKDAKNGLSQSLGRMGYEEYYRYYHNDDLNIINICLYL